MTEKEKVNGLRTAVRYGKLTTAEALVEYHKQAAATGLRSPKFEAWLVRRSR